MGVMPQKLVSNYKCKSGEKVEFDLLHFMDSNGFVLERDGFRIFKSIKKKKERDAEGIALILLGPILKRKVRLKESVLLMKWSKREDIINSFHYLKMQFFLWF